MLYVIFLLPYIIVILIALLIVCIILTAVREATASSRPSSYVRASPRDEWVPVEPVSKQRSWEPSQHKVDVKVCSCGKWNAPGQLVCWSCNADISSSTKSLQTFTFETAPQCAVCSYWVYPGERIILCPACHTQGHRAHMLEYVKAKGTCPVCHHRFNAEQLLTAVPIIGPPKE
jgi:hypothetical protein